MRNWIIGAAALLAVTAPSVAAAQTGYVGVVYGNVDTDGAGDADVYGAEGAVAFAGSGSISFEVDGSFLDSDGNDSSTALTGHVFARNDSHLFGGFVGISDSSDTTTWTAGLEASKYLESWTLAGALVYANNDDLNADGYGVNVEARVFATDNLRLQANAGWASIDFGGGDDDALTLGVGGEYQFAALPISIVAGYNHTELDTANVESEALTVGIRYNWGGTLRDRDRNGASQAGIAGFSL